MQDNAAGGATYDREKVELRVSLRELWNRDVFSKTDAKVIVSTKDESGKWVKLGQTEEVPNSLNPDFKQVFVMEFIFERKQFVRFDVEDVDMKLANDYIGYVELQLGAMVGAVGGISKHQLKNDRLPGKKCGFLIVSAQKVPESHEFLQFSFHGYDLKAPGCFGGKLWPFYRIYQEIPQHKENSMNKRMVADADYKRDVKNPVWEKFDMSLGQLCQNDKNKVLIFEMLNYSPYEGKHKLIGQFKTTVNDIINGKTKHVLRVNEKSKVEKGHVEFKNVLLETRPSFLDYVRGGQLFKVILAIDFTASNGYVHTPSSLHYINKNGKLNQYEQAIYEVCPIILNFDKDMNVPVYGFGGQPCFKNGISSSQTQHIFALTGKPEEPYVYGLQGIFSTYHSALSQVKLSTPTYFADIIDCAVQFSEHNQKENTGVYTILLILTDGAIHDLEKTIDKLVEGATKPLSVIIIGVGSDDFSMMKQLDCDNGRLRSHEGKVAERDIVQFVSFKDYQGNIVRLSEEVLAELPTQFLEYSRMREEIPKDPIKVDFNDIQLK